MATNKSTAAQQNEVKEIVVDAHFVTRSYDRKDDNGKVEKQEYISLELIDPFNDEDFREIALKAKWDKYDPKSGRLVRPDRVFDLMKYYAKKSLHTCAAVKVKITIKPVKYKSKQSGEMVTYPAMFAAPTFAELEEERAVEVVVKKGDEYNVFSHLAGRALGITFTPRENPDDYDSDIGLQ